MSAAPTGAPLVIVYADFECPYCAALELRLRTRRVRVCFRHFPVRAKHPRAWAAAQAVEAAALQGAFWPMHDALFADQGRLEDPHLWARAERLGLDVDRFDADARSQEVASAHRAATSAPASGPASRDADAVPARRRARLRPPGRRGLAAARAISEPTRQLDDGDEELVDLAHDLDEAVEVDRLGHVGVGVQVVGAQHVLLGLGGRQHDHRDAPQLGRRP